MRTFCAAGFDDCPLEVATSALEYVPAVALGKFQRVARRTQALAFDTINQRVNRLLNRFFTADEKEDFRNLLNTTSSCVWGRSAMEVACPTLVDKSSTLLVICSFTTLANWAHDLVKMGWDPVLLRRGESLVGILKDSFTLAVDGFDTSFLDGGPPNENDMESAASDHALLTFEKGNMTIDLYISASECPLPVMFSALWTSDLIFFDRTHLYVFHPDLLSKGISLWRKDTCDAFMRHDLSTTPLEGTFRTSTALYHLAEPCGANCVAQEFHLNWMVPTSVVWKFCWNLDNKPVFPSYVERGWVWRNGTFCSNRIGPCKFAADEVDFDVEDFVTGRANHTT